MTKDFFRLPGPFFSIPGGDGEKVSVSIIDASQFRRWMSIWWEAEGVAVKHKPGCCSIQMKSGAMSQYAIRWGEKRAYSSLLNGGGQLLKGDAF